MPVKFAEVKPAERYVHPDWGRPVKIYCMFGQSNLDGRDQWEHVREPDMPKDGTVDGAVIFDRCAQTLRFREPPDANFRPLTPGYTEKALAPWMNRSNTWFGPEISFAHTLRQLHPKNTVAIIKLGVGGSITGNRNHWSWNVAAPQDVNLLSVFREAYIRSALGKIVSYTKDYEFAGFISYVGTSDARYLQDAKSHYRNMKAIVANLRETVAGETPWLHIAPYDYKEPNGRSVTNIRMVRKQAHMLASVPGVTVQDLENPHFHRDDWLHQDWRGILNLGTQMAFWAGDRLAKAS